MTVFQGDAGVAGKAQLFRAEWAGLAQWARGAIGWQSPGAAHPHGQFDARAEAKSEEENAKLIKEIEEEIQRADDIPEDFSGAFDAESLANSSGAWTGMHFASASRWNELPWTGDMADVTPHASSPSCPAEIRRWIVAVICYIRNELQRNG